MSFIFRVTLRQGTPDVLRTKITGATEAEGRAQVEEWIRHNGHPGDTFGWTRDGPSTLGAGDYGQGVVQ